MDLLKINPAKLAAFIAEGSHPYLPVLRAVQARACDIMSVFQVRKNQVPPVFAPPERTNSKGLVLTIGDDLDESRGVAGFDAKSLSDVLAEAGLVVVQVAMFRPDIMAQVAGAAAVGLTAVVIETRERHELEWINFVKANSNCPTIVVTPKPTQ